MANRLTVALVGFRGPTDNRRVSIATEGLISGEEVALGAFFDCSATMFANPIPAPSKGGATWKHLFTPIRTAKTPEVAVRSTAKVRTERPETYDLRQSAETYSERVEGKSRVNVLAPTGSAHPEGITARAVSKAKAKRPKTAAITPEVRTKTYTRAVMLPPIPSVVVMPVSVRARTYYSYWEPETVQNLPEEILMFL